MQRLIVPRKGGAFTLVELLVVLAIISILASIAVSQYTSYMAKARISSYALPLARACFAEIVSYCTSEGIDGAVNLSSFSNCSNSQTAGGMVVLTFQSQPRCSGGTLSEGELHATIQGINTYKVICSVDAAPFKCWIE